MLRILFISLIIFSETTLEAQDIQLPIIVSKNWCKQHVCKYNGKRLNYRGINEVVKGNDSALFEIKRARSLVFTSLASSFTGGILCGLFIGGLLKGNIENVVPFGIGCALISISFPLEKSIIKHSQKSIEMYNRNLIALSTAN